VIFILARVLLRVNRPQAPIAASAVATVFISYRRKNMPNARLALRPSARSSNDPESGDLRPTPQRRRTRHSPRLDRLVPKELASIEDVDRPAGKAERVLHHCIGTVVQSYRGRDKVDPERFWRLEGAYVIRSKILTAAKGKSNIVRIGSFGPLAPARALPAGYPQI